MKMLEILDSTDKDETREFAVTHETNEKIAKFIAKYVCLAIISGYTPLCIMSFFYNMHRYCWDGVIVDELYISYKLM